MSAILLVDDEAYVLSLMCACLEGSGHVLLKASTAEEAYARFEEADAGIGLLIVDVNLRGTSGIRVALELRSLLPNLAVILTSGYTPDMWDQDDLAALNELTAESIGVLQKPFLPATLLKAVSRFLNVPLRAGVALAKAAGS